MRPNQPNVLTREGKADERGCSFGRVALALTARYDAVGDFNRAGGVRRTFESRTADDATAVAMNHEEPVAPRIRAGGTPQGGEPIGRYVIRYEKLSEAVGRGQAQELFKTLRLVDQ